ncbi:MAG: hypothetical protein RL514_3854 [Verrucomicrobiota bacterium]|jgi:hypothetical protein
MELALQQKLVARLVTDRAFREKFFADPARVAASEGLTVAAESLAQIQPEQVRLLTRVHRRRRLAQAGMQLPLTRKALGARFADLFRNYAVTPPPGKHPFEDALGFAAYLAANAGPPTLEHAWMGSLVRYEAAHLAATWQRKKFIGRVFPHAIGQLVELLATGEVPVGEYRRTTLAIWWRSSNRARLKHWRL